MRPRVSVLVCWVWSFRFEGLGYFKNIFARPPRPAHPTPTPTPTPTPIPNPIHNPNHKPNPHPTPPKSLKDPLTFQEGKADSALSSEWEELAPLH